MSRRCNEVTLSTLKNKKHVWKLNFSGLIPVSTPKTGGIYHSERVRFVSYAFVVLSCNCFLVTEGISLPLSGWFCLDGDRRSRFPQPVATSMALSPSSRRSDSEHQTMFQPLAARHLIDPHRPYESLFRHALRHWTRHPILLALGTSLLRENLWGIKIFMIYMGRALPVAWRVIEHKSSFVALFFRCLLLVRRAFGTGPLLNAAECSRDFSCRQGIREPATGAQSFTVWLGTAYSHQKQSGSTTVPLYPRRILSVTQPHAASFFKVLYTFLLRRLRYNAFMAFMSSIYILRTQPSGREMIWSINTTIMTNMFWIYHQEYIQ